MRKVVSAQEMRAIERAAENQGVTVHFMIERAGAGIARKARELSNGGHVLFLVGPGNNGSDGLVAADDLRRSGHQVSVYGFRRAGRGMYEGRLLAAEDDPDQGLLKGLVQQSTVIVDSLLGIGQSRAPEGLLASILDTVEESKAPGACRMAVDIPTGVNADTGAVPGAAFSADTTLCMGYLKRGVVLPPGKEYSGRTLTVDVGLPESLDDVLRVSVPSPADIARLLPARPADGNKGTYGTVIVAGGSRNFVGAPALVAGGAYRVGAGLVALALPEGIQDIVATHTLEAIFYPLADVNRQLAPSSLPDFEEALSRASAIVLGPGMGASENAKMFVEGALKAMDAAQVQAAVIDADGLNSLAQIPEWWNLRTPLIVTPHPGEMSRLTGRTVEAIQRSRIEAAVHYATRWKQIVVLKGAGTVVASPDGEAVVNPTGGPNLATAGTGDVLAGTIGGFLAQGCDPWSAAVLGVYLHGAAGDILRVRHGDAGTLAGDLLHALPEARLSLMREVGATI